MKRLIFLFHLITLLSFGILHATDYYVNASTGNNTTGNGSSGSPWKTITYALSQIGGTGHTLYVSAGTYNTALGETFPILMEDGVSLVGAGIDVSVVDAGGTNTVIRCVSIVDAGTKIEGFTIMNGFKDDAGGGGIHISAGSALHINNNHLTGNSGGYYSGFSSAGAIYVSNSSPKISDNLISGNQGRVECAGAIYITGSSSAPFVTGNLITGNTTEAGGGFGYKCGSIVIIEASGTIIQGNELINNASSDYAVSTGDIFILDCSPTIRNNVIAKSNMNGIYVTSSSQTTLPKIINNTISDNDRNGIQIGFQSYESCSADSILNNIISYNTEYGIYERGSATDPVKVWYNLFYANGLGLYLDEGTTDYYTASLLNSNVAECVNNLSGDPLFVDKANGNYYTQSGSSAIDAGDPNSPLDPDATRADIGAFYFDQPTLRSMDSLALVALYDSTGGINWTDKTNWKSSNPIDTWFGVTVSGGRVNYLDLTYNNLTGRLPSVIGDLSELVSLKLGSNNLSSTIPSEVGNLSALEELYIHGNQFTGTIPPSIGNMSSLRILYLQLNYLTGSIPHEIGNLSQVQLITVSGNDLSDSIPSEIGNLTNLTALYLNGNQFSGTIPTTLGNLTGLQYLTLSDNQLTGSIPTELGALTQLQWLWLASNHLSGSIPSQIGNLTHLTQLFLDHNTFVGDVPDLSGMTNLEELRLHANRFSGLPDFSSISSLTDLIVDHNMFTFEDIEPNIGAPSSTFTYSPQDSVGAHIDTTVEAGSIKEFTILVGGASNQYQWYKNGIIIGGATSASYTIPSVTYLDSGTYHCRITNTVATALTLYSRTFKLHVGLIPPPTISSFSPTSGPIGTSVTITGNNFNATATNNVVYFGAVKANVINSTSTELTVTVPVSATYASITVTDTTTGLTAYSGAQFIVTFPGTQTIDATSFEDRVDFLAGATPRFVAIGDLDGDGKADLVIANTDDNTISVFRNTSTAGIISASSLADKVDFVTGINPRCVAVGDLDGDGKPDLAVANAGSGSISVYRNTCIPGSITGSSFAPKVDFTCYADPISVAIGDLDGDGKPDLAAANWEPALSKISVFKNTSMKGIISTGSFASKVDFAAETNPCAITFSDIDADKKADVVVATPGSSSLSLFKNTSVKGSITSGSLAAKVNFAASGAYYNIAAGDLDGDGKPDVVVTDYNSVSVFKNTTSTDTINTSSLDPKVSFATGTNPTSISICDLDGDGRPDLAVSNNSSQSISVLKNVSVVGTIEAGSFNSNFDFASGLGPYSIAAGDIDGDGNPDLITANTNGTVSILRNNSPSLRTVDSLTLVTLYDSTGGPNWTIKTNWKSSNPITTWFGVVVTGDRVTGLSIGSNHLVGLIPHSIGLLTQLTVLDLYQNELAGQFPTEIGNLTHLQNLNLSRNQLSGSIPAQIGNLTALTYLGLYMNSFSGPIPSPIGNLSLLTGLELHYNQLSGPIPLQIGNLTQLRELRLCNNMLSGDVPGINGLVNLQRLDVSSNQLSGLADLNILSNLIDLSIEGNQFTFEDIEPNIGVPNSSFIYSPQDSVGEYKDTTAEAGSTKEFTVFVGGASNQYQWYKNGNIIGGATLASYVIPSVVYLDSGTYHCQITNTVASALTLYSRTFKLHVIPSLRSSDSLALVALYDSTGGDNWINKTNWKSSNPIDTWYGISLVNGRVNHLAPHANNLTGTIPSAIANLTALEYLYLNDNQLTGSIPIHVFSLSGLISLQLQNNQFSGSIPTQIGNLSELTYLDLSGNQLSGNIPLDIGNLLLLEHLIVYSNFLSGSIPNEIGNLTNLRTLSLELNSLSGSIPESIGNLTQLQTVGLYSNLLSGSIPSIIGNLTQLKSLQLAHNQLIGSIPVTIGTLTLLEQIALDNNQLTGSIPTEIGNLVNLQEIVLSSNQLSGSVPASFSGLTKIKNMDLSNNNLIDLPDLTAVDSLLTLSINNNQFTFEDIEPNIGAPSVAFLYWPQDSVGLYFDTTLTAGSYSSFPIFVGGSNNQYTWYRNSVPPPNMSMTCTILSVSFADSGTYYCRITNTVATELTLYSRTYRLQVTPSARILDSLALVALFDSAGGDSWINKLNWKSSNPIDTWYGVNVLSGRVGEINLGSNHLVGSLPSVIGNLTQLNSLNLWQNQLYGSIPEGLGNLIYLNNINLWGNQLSGPIPGSIGNLTELDNLILFSNQLSGPLPSQIGNMLELKVLALDGNQLTGSIPPEIGNLTRLEELGLSGNILSGVLPGIDNLNFLTEIHLSGNQLEDLPDLSSLPSLGELQIENNRLTFEDIEPQFGKSYSVFTYSPQDSVGTYSTLTMLQGSSNALTVTVGGSHNQYQWMKNGVDIPDATSNEYYKLYWDVPDSGNYVCRITNTVATELTLYSRHTRVIVYPMPTMPGNLVAVPVTSSRIDLSWTASSDATKYFISRSLISGSGFNVIDSVNVPATSYSNTGLSVNTTYYYRIYAANQYGGTSSNSNEVSATTLGLAPSLGTPNVSNPSPIPGAAVTITVTATGTSPAVKLFYGKTTQSEGDSLAMTFNGTNYNGTIPGASVTQEGVWFRIRAQNTGGIVYYPGTTTKANISVTINDMTSIWDNSYFYGGIPAEQYFSIAMSMDGSLSLTDLWGTQTLEEGIPTNWRAWDFNQPSQSFVDVTSLAGDKAYFLFHREGSAQEIFNNVTSKKTNDPLMFDNFLLKPGWNAVPWPFTFPANIYIKDTNQDSIGSLWKLWGNSGWEQVTECSAFCGYMIYNKTAGNVRLGNVVSWTMMATKPMIDQSGWRLRLIAESGTYRDAFNFLGVSMDYSTLSEAEPLTIGKSVTLNFKHNEQNLSSDIRSDAEDGHIWDLSVLNTSGNDHVILKWDSGDLPADLHIRLIDVSNNKILRLDETIHEYEFRTHRQNIFKLIAGNAEFVEREALRIKATLPDEFGLSQNYPNPFNPSTTIKFDVARSGQVKLKVYNILGQEIATLINGYFETGQDYSVIWDGRDSFGRVVASGMYICRLEAGRTTKTRKMMFVK